MNDKLKEWFIELLDTSYKFGIMLLIAKGLEYLTQTDLLVFVPYIALFMIANLSARFDRLIKVENTSLETVKFTKEDNCWISEYGKIWKDQTGFHLYILKGLLIGSYFGPFNQFNLAFEKLIEVMKKEKR